MGRIAVGFGPGGLALDEAHARLFVLNHLEALDHCPTRRSDLRLEARRRGLQSRVQVPEDGACLRFDLQVHGR